MAVKLRLARHGAKKHPYYRIVAANSREGRDGRFLEQIGAYDPNRNPIGISLKRERVSYWLGQGAQASDTVASLLRRYMATADTMGAGIDKAKPRPVIPTVTEAEEAPPKAKAKAAQEAPAQAAPAAKAPAAEAAPAAKAAPAADATTEQADS